MQRFFFVFLLCVIVFVPARVFAQSSDEVRAVITQVVEQSDEGGLRYALFEAVDSDGVLYRIDTREGYLEELRYNLNEGQKILLQVIDEADGSTTVFFMDVVRTNALIWITLFFALVAVIVGRLRGVFALVGLAVTLLVLFALILPRILSGADPVVTTVLGSLVILAVNMHLSHGLSRRTFMAFLSTVVGLILVVVFAKLFVGFAHLSGLASEEAALLYLKSTNLSIPSGLLLAGIILGAVGVLYYIAITQSETVSELIEADSRLSAKELYKRAMRVGRHHIASVVNTLVLAYAGVALPLFLLFLATGSIETWRFLNEEVVAEEIIRTIAGTVGLIFLVPISTWFAVLSQKKK
ncbi:MAG: YibE/F family protein [bacterium]|nr:YibE/F family protein [bacterium]